MFPSTSQRFAMAVTGLSLLACVSASAVEYLLRPRIEQRVDYNDNLRLGAVNQIESFGYLLSPRISATATSENIRISGDARLDTFRFDEDRFNTDNQHGSLTFGHFTARRQLQFSASLDRESLLDAEFDATGFAGIAASRVERVSTRPVGIWQLNELNSVTVGGSYSSVHYASRTFNDYHNVGVDVTWARQLSERFIVDVSAFGSEYSDIEPGQRCDRQVYSSFRELTGLTSRTLGLQVGLRQALTERVEWSVALGTRDIKSDAVQRDCNFLAGLFGLDPLTETSGSESSSGLITTTSASYTGKRLTVEGGFERSVSPAGLGFLLETDRITGNVRYRLSELSDLGLRLLSTQADSITTGFPFNRESQTALATYSRRLSERWRVGAGLRYRTQNASFLVGRANAVSTFLELDYVPQPIQVAR